MSPRIVPLIILLIMLSILVYRFWKDITFYRNNGWDFSKESGIKSYRNDVDDEHSNRSRLYFSHPCAIGVTAFMIGFLMVSMLDQ
ncbi:hypothetical protein [Aminobacter sp. LjRoot7]|uniref:hypothetical protein n=1 Tax=Aminobacter sp. LjRoot7 TaxID=3342335 RepID=UPI003ECF54E9